MNVTKEFTINANYDDSIFIAALKEETISLEEIINFKKKTTAPKKIVSTVSEQLRHKKRCFLQKIDKFIKIKINLQILILNRLIFIYDVEFYLSNVNKYFNVRQY